MWMAVLGVHATLGESVLNILHIQYTFNLIIQLYLCWVAHKGGPRNFDEWFPNYIATIKTNIYGCLQDRFKNNFSHVNLCTYHFHVSTAIT